MPSNPTRLRTVAETALVTRRPHRTIRTWARDGRITSTHDPRGRLLVDLVQASALSEQTGRRNRTRAA